MGQSSECVYRFGPFRYDPAQRLLSRDGDPVPLPPKALDLLAALLHRRGEAVSKEDLLRTVWPDCAVEEIGLARNVSILRKALGDEAGEYIETIPKRGYRLAGGAPARRRRSRARVAWAAVLALALAAVIYWQFYRPSRFVPRAPGEASLAVLPFQAVAGDSELQTVSAAVYDAIVAEMAKSGGATVISPATIQRYRTLHIPAAVMARMLGLDVTVEGSMQRAGRQLTISLRLADVHSGKLIWAETYDAAPTDVAELHRTVVAPASKRIREHLSAR